jgi:hypothetical protein
MQFMLITHANKDSEAGVPPSPELIAAIGKMAEEGYKSGKIVATGGLLPSKAGVRMKLSGGKITATDGPFTESKELIGGFAIANLASREEALEMCRNFMNVHAQVLGPGYEMSCEVRPMYEPGGPCPGLDNK